ncbi:DUF2523 family protein [Photobacterium sanguinicancri]|uniref:DUF2523 family protein n=1 Tax=Photobacterium sanguinicancri TaxID=875932 RepID=UPI0026E31251|nr:DUF2523 family protein [Photobacterium sanguinicancri]MDO6499244.1 DUF2523 family protein [Photobacterium sanguinicancri]MDO6499252.1 DUF2523 family protein [Photobacterium sanguinicancri]
MLDWFAERWNDFITWGLSLLLSVFDMLSDFVCLVFEVIFNAVVGLVQAMGDVFGSFSLLQYLSMLPDGMLNVMALVGANEASAIIVSAVFIRVTLQLIPFVRLGS